VEEEEEEKDFFEPPIILRSFFRRSNKGEERCPSMYFSMLRTFSKASTSTEMERVGHWGREGVGVEEGEGEGVW